MGIFQQFPYSNFHEMNLDQIIKIMREMQDEWENTKTEWANYKEYIDNYFANLDLSEETLQALRALIADGTFSDTVDPIIITATTQWLNDNITPTTPAIDKSLSVSDAAADARVAGDCIDGIADNYAAFVDGLDILFTKGKFQHGVYNPITNTTSNMAYRIGSREVISYDTPVQLLIKNGFRVLPYVFSGGTWSQESWKTGSYNLNPANKYQFQIARETEDVSEVADFTEFISAVTLKYTYSDIMITDILSTISTEQKLNADDYIKIEMEEGGYAVSDGTVKKTDVSNRLRSKYVYKVSKGQKFIVSSRALIQFVIYIVDAIVNGSSSASSGWTSIDSTQTEKVYECLTDGYAYVVCKRTDNAAISIADYEDANNNAYAYHTNSFEFNIPERTRHIYHFGGNGNDWCFVYTPDDYDPHRAKPYPFVICNHGNGWAMTGHPSGANWTKRTMYVPYTDPDYINDPSNYNGTDNNQLYYSNPTIELLRANGYVVCGTMNYADLLYGNDNCRNACVDFFNHMVSHYNVEDRCYMIGASNGALTSLNAGYILQGKIKAMILQYPITCLYNQYASNSSHAAQIDTAYAIPPGSTEAQIKECIKTHDPMTTDVVDSQKVGCIAATKIWASPGDTVAQMSENATPYTAMVSATKVCELVQVTGAHGNYTHFDPQAFLAWFEQYK